MDSAQEPLMRLVRPFTAEDVYQFIKTGIPVSDSIMGAYPMSHSEENAWMQWVFNMGKPDHLHALLSDLTPYTYDDAIREFRSGMRQNRTSGCVGGQGSGKTTVILSDIVERHRAKWESGFFDVVGTPTECRKLDPHDIFNDVSRAVDTFRHTEPGRMFGVDDPRHHISAQMKERFKMDCHKLADAIEKIREYGCDMYITAVRIDIIPEELLKEYSYPRMINPATGLSHVVKFQYEHVDAKWVCVGFKTTPHPEKIIKKPFCDYTPQEYMEVIIKNKREMMEKSLDKNPDLPCYEEVYEFICEEDFVVSSATMKARMDFIMSYRPTYTKEYCMYIERAWAGVLRRNGCLVGDRVSTSLVTDAIPKIKEWLERMLSQDDTKWKEDTILNEMAEIPKRS